MVGPMMLNDWLAELESHIYLTYKKVHTSFTYLKWYGVFMLTWEPYVRHNSDIRPLFGKYVK